MQHLDSDVRELSVAEYRLIVDEHARLDKFLRDLSEACSEFDSLDECQGCDKGKVASCQGRLISFKHVFLDFLIEHFKNEEKIMSNIFRTQGTNERFRLHQQEHDKLLREMDSLMHKLSNMSEQGLTAVAIRELHHRVMELFGKHARMFDVSLMRQPKNGEK